MSYRDTNHLKSTFQRELWSEVGIWMQERAQTLWDGGMPDEAAALYSEFARGPLWANEDGGVKEADDRALGHKKGRVSRPSPEIQPR